MSQDASYTFLVEWYWRGQQGQHFSSVFMGIIRKALLDTYFASLSLEDPADFHNIFVLLLSVTDFIQVCIYLYRYLLHRGDFGKNSSKYGETVGVSYLT